MVVARLEPDLAHAPQRGERRPELVGGVGGEAPQVLEGSLELLEGLVERVAELLELRGALRRKPLVEVLRR